ncbi:MAG: hypothetical protein A3F67_04500 [Verrucomicrobia bacterium RIFCSPHIGHO2_12_FULL_41_10]|nr:MAG: hypothetical protein A3F67_04500 [Verrucomicrobia bacterium RIFCSPHIGHO2_12_FULL_41_10]HLB32656.1 trigger factor [Chthoniobacterales bacterium]
MKITIEQKEPCLIDLHIELPQEHFEKEWEHVVNEYQKVAEIPGFRKGKAPRSSIEKKHALDIRYDVIEQLTENAIKRALEEEKIDSLGEPIIKEKQLREDHSFYLVVTVIKRPEFEFEASDYLNLEVEIEKRNYDAEKMFQKFLEKMQLELAIEKELPPMDDNLAHQIIPGHTLEEVKQVVNDSIKKNFEKSFELEAKEAIKEKILKNIPFAVPFSLMEKIKGDIILDFIEECEEDEFSPEKIESVLKDFEPVAQESAVKELQWMFIAQAIAEKESFEVTNDEIFEAIKEDAGEMNLSVEELLQEIEDDEDLPSFYGKAMEDKVLEFIYSHTKVIEVPAALKDL